MSFFYLRKRYNTTEIKLLFEKENEIMSNKEKLIPKFDALSNPLNIASSSDSINLQEGFFHLIFF